MLRAQGSQSQKSLTADMDRLNEYAPLVNEFVNKNNIHVLSINNVVKTIADVVRNYLLGNVPCTCKDVETSACTKKLLRFRQYSFLLKIGKRRFPIKDRRELIILNASIVKQVLRHALPKLQKHSTACCKDLCQRKYKQTVARLVNEEA